MLIKVVCYQSIKSRLKNIKERGKNVDKKKILLSVASVMLLTTVGSLTSCGESNNMSNELKDGYEVLSSADLDESTKFISLETYRDKVKGGLVGSMAGVAYGYPLEFKQKNWIPEANLTVWYDDIIQNAYDQDDIYLSITAIESMIDLGLDANSRDLGIYMYNKDFEFWNGSNNDVLARGYAPPFSGYPKYSTQYLTGAYPDGNSYQCGASFGGFLGLNMTGFINQTCQKYAEICCYGDGIYAMQFISSMYGASFFTEDINEIIQAGLDAIPNESWSAKVIHDVIDNYKKGMSARENYLYLQDTYINSDEYNWIGWPYNGILLDAKMCSAFTVIGLLYGEKNMEKSMKLTVQCANDSDSTCAATAGILSIIKGYKALDQKYKNGLIEKQKFKYSNSTIDDVVNNCETLIKNIVTRQGGKIAYVDNVLSLVIPASATTATIEAYKNSKYPEKMELMTYTEEEMARMRTISDPGFERSVYALSNGWKSNKVSKTAIEWMKQTSYKGLCNAKITASLNEEVNLMNTVSVKENTNYTLSCMVKTSDAFSSKFELVVNNSDANVLRRVVCQVGTEWTKVSMVVNSGKNSTLQIGAILTGANNTDFVRVDDFEFQKKL